jgi:hypothetical protein
MPLLASASRNKTSIWAFVERNSPAASRSIAANTRGLTRSKNGLRRALAISRLAVQGAGIENRLRLTISAQNNQ